MAQIQCSAAEIGNPSPGDTVKMRVDSVEDGMATLSYAKPEADDNMKPEPSAMKDMAAAFSQSEE